jgi:hypothetical protein
MTPKPTVCTYDKSMSQIDRKGSSCQVDTTNLGPCTEANEFGYKLGAPCVLIKLNRVCYRQ